MDILPENKKIARYLRDTFQGEIDINRYWDDEKKSWVDILEAKNSPENGLVTYSTIALSGHDIGFTLDDGELRVELTMTVGDECKIAANILSTCALNIMNDGVLIEPGAVFENAVVMHDEKTALKHIMFVSPFLFPLESQKIDDKTVTWLQAIPISDGEAAFLEEHGPDALEEKFEELEIDIADLQRVSVIN